MRNNEDLFEDKYFQDEYVFYEEKKGGELIENQHYNSLSEEYVDIINATLRYNSLQKEYNDLNKTVNENKYINDFVKGLNPPTVLFEENNVVAVTILPRDTTFREVYLTGLKRVFKKNNINIRNINHSFFHPLIYRFNNKHNQIEWELAYLIYEDIPSKKKIK